MSKFVAISKTESESSDTTWKPHAYQKRAIKWLLERASAGLFLDPGLGKTSITLGAIKVLKKRGLFTGALVIAPLRVCHLVWPEEVKKWSDFHGLTVEVLHGKDKEAALNRQADIYLINPEGLEWLFGPAPLPKKKPDKDAPLEVQQAWLRMWTRHQKELTRAAPLTKAILKNTSILVVDESTKFKHQTAKRFKILKQFLPKFSFRWILTGSPAPNGYLDLFGQCYVMDLGRALGQYISHYRNNYFLSTGFGGFTYVLKSQADKLIQERLRPSVLSMRAEDYIDMPDLIDNVVRFDLPEEAAEIYKEMEDEMFVELEAQEIEAVNAAVASMKCRQIANGALYKDRRKGDAFFTIHDAKLHAVQDLVEELSGQPLLLAYEFGHDLERLKKAFPKVPVIGESSKRDKEITDEFNAGGLPLVLGQPAGMAHGLNLQGACRHVGFFSVFWDFELTDQFIRRVFRQGQKAQSVTVHTFVARKTVDELMLKTRRSKDKTQQTLMLALKSLRKRK